VNLNIQIFEQTTVHLVFFKNLEVLDVLDLLEFHDFKELLNH
jgi:hypothetical protein